MCDCTIDAATVEKMICVEDFCGSCTHTGFHHAIQFWADWDGVVTHFGGNWAGIPHLGHVPLDACPTQEMVWAHVRHHNWKCDYNEP